MAENSHSYAPSSLQFSSSKLYFQYQNQLLQKIWFISPMSIDINFKYTFQEVQNFYFIEWWEFEWLTADHEVYEQWIIYKIGFLNPKFKNVEHLSLDLKKSAIYDNLLLWSLLKWFLWWGIAFLLLWRLAYKFQWGQVLLRLNVIGAWVLLAFYIWKIARVLFKLLFKTKRVEYGWFMVNYVNQSDALMISSDVIELLKKMNEEYQITKFCYTWNCIYLLQDIHERIWLDGIFTRKIYSEQKKADLQQRTMSFIHQEEFLSQFILN